MFRTRSFAILGLLYPLAMLGDGVAGPRTPIIIAGGSITVYSMQQDSDTWDRHKADPRTFKSIHVRDHASFQFFPSMKGDNPQPSTTGKLASSWKIRVFTKEDKSKNHFLEVEGEPNHTFTVRTSHAFSARPHRDRPGYDGRSFCETDNCNDPDSVHIDPEVRITGIRGQSNTSLFHCADETCAIFIGKPAK